MANRPMQSFVLFECLKSAGVGNVVSRADIVKALKVSDNSVPVYFSELKHRFGVKFETVKNGRSVVGYKLLSLDCSVRKEGLPRGRKPAPKAAKPQVAVVKKTAPVKTKKAVAYDANLEITEISDRDLDDIRTQLGIA